MKFLNLNKGINGDFRKSKIFSVENYSVDIDFKEELRFLVSTHQNDYNLFHNAIIVNCLNNTQLMIFKNILTTKYGDLNYSIIYQNGRFVSNDDLFDRALNNFYSGDYKKSVNDFDLISHISYNKIESLYYKSLALGALNDFENAISILDFLININPNDYRFWNDKGVFLMELDLVEDAFHCFDKSISLHPDSYNWSNKAVLYHNLKQWDRAIECYDEAIKLNQSIVFPIIGKAKVYFQFRDFKSVEECLDVACGINSCDLDFLVEKGKYLLFNNDYEKAMEYFNNALMFNDRLAVVWILKAVTFNYLNMFKESELCMDIAVNLD